MKILVVGGTGALGGHCAIHLASKGHDVSVGGRNPANPATQMAAMPFVQGDYVAGDYTPEQLAGFDWVVFAAGNDPRQALQAERGFRAPVRVCRKIPRDHGGRGKPHDGKTPRHQCAPILLTMPVQSAAANATAMMPTMARNP